MADFAPSERELQILKVLWEIGSGSVREVHRRLCPNDECAFNTVQTLLRIMEDKGLVEHRTEGRTFIYTFDRHVEDVLAALRAGAAPPIHARAGRRALELAEAAIRSFDDGVRVQT